MKRLTLPVFFLLAPWLWGQTAQGTQVKPSAPSPLPGDESGLADDDGVSDSAVSDPALAKGEGKAFDRQVTNLRLGFVNFRRIMRSIPQLATIRDDLDREFKQQKEALLEAQRTLKTMERQAERLSGEQDYASIEKKLIAKRRDVARRDAALRDNYSVRRNEELSKLQRKVLDRILSIAKANEYDVILNDTGVIYVSPRADLTALVIEQLHEMAAEEDRDQGGESDHESPR